MSETPEQAYISKVHLKGYKSIRDLEIDFKPGLNIIIGPNGSGKTNFTEGLIDRALLPKFNEKSFTSIEIKDSKSNLYEWSVQIDKVNKEEISIWEKVSLGSSVLKKNGKLLRKYDDLNSSYSFLKEELNSDFYKIFNPVKIGFGNINSISLLDTFSRLNINFEEKNINGNLWLRPFKKDILLDFDFSKIIDDFQIEDLFKEFEFKPNLIINLKRYTPIENLRLRQPIIFNKSLNDNTIYVDFLLFEFSVNNSWYTWNELSDGTKRIFYIVSQIIGWGGLIFLEEPELGIHPDQLHKLMDFLIEQSKEKQIIITTHSPEVLNAIHPDELDRIIVTRYDAEKGTVMQKLSPEQAKEMGDRIKEGDMFLSDRWVHLNLEDEIFNAAQLNEK